MSTRPTFIDLRSESYDTMRSGFPSERGHQSPRMQHFAGDIPPAMSPLDMFAAQSRLLAKQLDDSKRNGRRVSRLPPLTTGDPITKQKSIYQRSRSAEANNVSSGSSPRTRDEDQPGTIPGLEEPDFRPKSFYPRMSNVPPFEDDTGYVAEPSPERSFLTPAEFQQARPVQDYFAIPSAAEPVLPAGRGAEKMDRRPWVYHPRNPDNSYQNELQRGKSMESTSSRGHNGSLAPPKSPHVRHAGSIRSIPQDSSDDELSASTGGSGFSQHRKLSSSSGVSMPQSPLSPFAQAHRRSPSLNSEYSIGGSRQARPAFNFSRPLSRASRPSFEVTSRQPSFDSRPSTDVVRPPFNSGSRQPSADSQRMMFMDDTVQTPVSMVNEQLPESKEHPGAPAPSYIYTKFSLPRGRMLQRNSKVLRGDQMPLFDWERPVIPSNVRPSTPLAQRPMTPTESPRLSADRPSGETPRPLVEQASRYVLRFFTISCLKRVDV